MAELQTFHSNGGGGMNRYQRPPQCWYYHQGKCKFSDEVCYFRHQNLCCLHFCKGNICTYRISFSKTTLCTAIYHYDLLQKQSKKRFFEINSLFEITLYSLLHQIHMQHCYFGDHKDHLPSIQENHIYQELELVKDLEQDLEQTFPRKIQFDTKDK